MNFKLYVIDSETSGLNPELNDVIEVSMCRFTLDNPDESEQKTWLAKALNPSSIEEKALQINGHKREDILCMTKFGKENYLEPSVVVSDIEGWIMEDGVSIDERVFCGQNPEFDYNMLKAFWNKAGSENTFPFNKFVLDTIAIARMIDVCTGKQRARYNLANLVKDFGVTGRKAHRAAEDVAMTKDLLMKQLLPIMKAIIEAHQGHYQS